jgi:hypothetical protein
MVSANGLFAAYNFSKDPQEIKLPEGDWNIMLASADKNGVETILILKGISAGSFFYNFKKIKPEGIYPLNFGLEEK